MHIYNFISCFIHSKFYFLDAWTLLMYLWVICFYFCVFLNQHYTHTHTHTHTHITHYITVSSCLHCWGGKGWEYSCVHTHRNFYVDSTWKELLAGVHLPFSHIMLVSFPKLSSQFINPSLSSECITPHQYVQLPGFLIRSNG